jgi:hemoglobin-like flavoprotein
VELGGLSARTGLTGARRRRDASLVVVSILRDTLALALAREEEFPARFYHRLFVSHPDIRALFHRHAPAALRKMFAQKLTALVDHLEDPAWLERELAALATSHNGYGVTAEMYPWVGEALISTLAEACGDAWTPEADRAWRDVYAAITRAMLAASP